VQEKGYFDKGEVFGGFGRCWDQKMKNLKVL